VHFYVGEELRGRSEPPGRRAEWLQSVNILTVTGNCAFQVDGVLRYWPDTALLACATRIQCIRHRVISGKRGLASSPIHPSVAGLVLSPTLLSARCADQVFCNRVLLTKSPFICRYKATKCCDLFQPGVLLQAYPSLCPRVVGANTHPQRAPPAGFNNVANEPRFEYLKAH
jgi:hypothetical protein